MFSKYDSWWKLLMEVNINGFQHLIMFYGHPMQIQSPINGSVSMD